MDRNGLLRRLGPALLFVGFLSLYLLTLTDVHTFDALSYVRDVDIKPWRELFHPHHLAYGPFGAFISAVSTRWATSALLPLQVANALAGALGVALFYGVARAHLASRVLPYALALTLGGSYAYWYYAVEVEVYTIAAVFLILALGLLMRLLRRANLSPGTLGEACALGFVQGLAVLFHQTNVLLVLPAIIALLLGLRGGSRNRGAGGTRASVLYTTSVKPVLSDSGYVERTTLMQGRSLLLLAYSTPLALVVGVSYLWVGFGVSGFRSMQALIDWARGYTATGWWGGPLDGNKVSQLGTGLAETFMQPGGELVLVLIVVLLLANARRLVAQHQATLVLVSWLLVYGFFFFWWEPDNIEFWIASLPPLLLLVGLAIDNTDCTEHQARKVGGQTLVLFGLAAAMLVVNGMAIAERGDATRDLQRHVARMLAQQTQVGDLLLVPDGLQEVYLPYYEGRENVLSLNQALFDQGGDWQAACTHIRSRIDIAQQSGFAVLIAAEVLRPTPAQIGEIPTPLDRFGLQQAQIDTCFAPIRLLLDDLALASQVPPYYRIAPATVLAVEGWDFRRGRWGWQAANVAEEMITNAGWRLVPQVDSALTSPPLYIEPGAYRTVEIRLAAETAARDAQLFLLDAQGQADEARAIRWTLRPGTEMQRYELDLGQVAEQGIVTRLRLDPIGIGDGGAIVVESIRLIR
ncbi:DUF2723 domain-containing protein [Candidatus Gracilibacteria bacterium]|nr:DUF2723 domain-containing protein [Candidatus Gracilibacteria bacterium]